MNYLKNLIIALILIGFSAAEAQKKAEKELRLAAGKIEVQNYDAAIEHLKEAIKKANKENKNRYTYLMAVVHHVNKDTTEARKIYESIPSGSWDNSYKMAQSMLKVLDKEPANAIAVEKRAERVKQLEKQLDSLGKINSEIVLTKDKDSVTDFAIIESIPYMDQCKSASSNFARKQCFNKEIQKLVSRNFDSGLASDLGHYGSIRLYCQFTIDKEGEVTAVRVRGNHPILRLEAKRVVNLLPKLNPGMQKGKAVSVTYALPIKFVVTE